MKELIGILSANHSFILSSHIAPDPDAIGSSAALGLFLHRLGKRVTLYYFDRVPRTMERLVARLPKEITVVNQVPTAPVDAVLVTDTASRPRVGKQAEAVFALGKTVVNIDHHISNDRWGKVNYIDAGAAASAVIIAELIDTASSILPSDAHQNGGTPLWDELMADLLYAGLLDDTGSFRFNNTDARALQVAADLVGHGARASDVSRDLYYTVPLRILKLRAKVLSEMALVEDGKLTIITVPLQTLTTCGCSAEDTEGLVDEGRLVEGTLASVLIREMADGYWKCSLRSKYDDLDVGAIAARFEGGGHKAAAGCRIAGNQAQVTATIQQAMREAFDGRVTAGR